MSDQSEHETELEFECPLCGGAFEIGSQWIGHEVVCPHCGGGVELAEGDDDFADASTETGEASGIELRGAGPAGTIEALPDEPLVTLPVAGQSEAEPLAEPQPDDSPAQTSAEPPVADPSPEPQPLTVEEREALRRRVNLVLAIAGGVVLVVTFAVLAWLAQPAEPPK